MRRVGLCALVLAACVGPSDAPPLAPRVYTFGRGGPWCTAVVLEVFEDGSAELRRVGNTNPEPIRVELERADAEILLRPLEGDLKPHFFAESAVLRRTACNTFEVTLRTEWGDDVRELSAADPCIEENPPPDNGDEWDRCSLRLCNQDPC